jgi:anti-sigma-K factor RskA
MSDPHLLTGAYALDALDDVERAAVERHLRGCSECAEEVAEFREVGSWLAGRVAAAPPPEMKDRVLALARETRQVSPPTGHVRLPRVGPRRLLVAAAAAVVLAGGVGLGNAAWQNQQDAEQARLQATRITDVVTDPARRESVGRIAGGGAATVVAADGSAVFAARGLPPLPEDKTYQLWIVGGDHIESAGLLDVENGATRAWVGDAPPGSSLAVSVEPAGGSEQPTTTPIANVPVA